MYNTKCFYIGLLCLFFTSNVFSQTTIQGKILDEQGESLLGANVIINGTSQGTVSDQNGNFNLITSKDIPFEIEVSFIGFGSQNITVNAEQLGIITLVVENSFDEVIISASRRAEKLQEAPSAVSVITAKQVTESGGSLSPLRALINTPGVELQQQTGQRVNVALRGSNGVFSTSVFPMLDYRSLISPGLEFFDSQNSPINQIDVERVEVVLGPSSALYGPDVTSGVVHFISKDPFKHPGTTAELIYGQRNTFKVALRHGGHNTNETFGYKINARYGSGNDFTLDPDDTGDQAILNNFRTAISRASISNAGNVNTDESGTKLFDTTQTQIPGYWSAAANASLYFRPKNGMEVVTAGGWNAGKAIFYNDLGEGQAYGNEYWGQARFKYKGWFAQTYYIKNDGGNDSNPNYLNRTGLIVPLERSHYEAQIQYNFNAPTILNSEWTVGLDYRDAKADTENHVYGRNEDNDDYTLYGLYAQAKFKLEPKLDLFLAGSYDGYNFTSEKTFSPRAALVFKPSEYQNLRFSFNQAANPLPASDLYFDLPIQTVPGVFDVWITGAVNPYTFGSNPQIDWLVPGVPNTPLAAGFPLAAAYAAVTGAVLEGLTASAAQDPSLAQLLPIVSGVLQNPASIPTGFSPLVTTDTNGQPLVTEDGNINLISTLKSFEFGYKGVFNKRLSVGFDLYYLEQKGNAGFQQISPVATIVGLEGALGQGVQTTTQPQIEALLIGAGLDAATAAATANAVGQQLNGAYTQAGAEFLQALTNAGLPFHGVIPTEQAPAGDAAKLIFGYITQDPNRVSTNWGFELNSKYFLTEHLTSFVNYSWFSRSEGQPGDLNFPQNKVRSGVSYQSEERISGSFSYQWDQGYTSNVANFPGEIDAKSLFDLTLGFKFTPELKLELAATNIFNNEFRALPGLPKIGRTATARILFDF